MKSLSPADNPFKNPPEIVLIPPKASPLAPSIPVNTFLATATCLSALLASEFKLFRASFISLSAGSISFFTKVVTSSIFVVSFDKSINNLIRKVETTTPTTIVISSYLLM